MLNLVLISSYLINTRTDSDRNMIQIYIVKNAVMYIIVRTKFPKNFIIVEIIIDFVVGYKNLRLFGLPVNPRQFCKDCIATQ